MYYMKFISTFVKKSQGRIIGISPQKYYENQMIESGYLFNLQDNSLINHMKISKDNINKITNTLININFNDETYKIYSLYTIQKGDLIYSPKLINNTYFNSLTPLSPVITSGASSIWATGKSTTDPNLIPQLVSNIIKHI